MLQESNPIQSLTLTQPCSTSQSILLVEAIQGRSLHLESLLDMKEGEEVVS